MRKVGGTAHDEVGKGNADAGHRRVVAAGHGENGSDDEYVADESSEVHPVESFGRPQCRADSEQDEANGRECKGDGNSE